MIEYAFFNKTLLKNECGIPQETYRDGFLTIESGKTLTFIVEEFLNDLACKLGLRPGWRKGEEVQILRWDFTTRL